MLKRIKTKQKIAGGVAIALIAAAGFYSWRASNTDQPPPSQNPNTSSERTEKNPAQPKPQKPLPSLQPTLDDWLAGNSGTYSVVVRDFNQDKIVAKSGANRPYFMASLYKLYVAYLALLDAQNGVHDLDEPFLYGYSRQKCIDKMIRESYSPCGEKYMAELGRENIEKRLSAYGLVDTDFGGFVTSAADIDRILARIYRGSELDKRHTAILLGAMRGQIYDDTIKAGAPQGVVVANKVGFRELVEYHDVAIIYLPDGRAFSISILTQHAGTRRIADLAGVLISAML